MGIALVGEPRVLFMDEPTSGLDSYTASEVMQVVKVCCCVCLPVVNDPHLIKMASQAAPVRILLTQVCGHQFASHLIFNVNRAGILRSASVALADVDMRPAMADLLYLYKQSERAVPFCCKGSGVNRHHSLRDNP